MSHALPSISEQKKKPYRPTIGTVLFYYRLLNELVFDRTLTRPYIVLRRMHRDWAFCRGHEDFSCEIHLNNSYYCRQWFLMILAHEMCHQYQWQVLGQERWARGQKPIMSHGPSFYAFRSRLNELGIPLKRLPKISRWFTQQNISRT